MQVLHVTHEWVLYAGRATEAYYDLTTTSSAAMWLRGFLPKRLQSILLQDGITQREWAGYLCLDYGLRAMIMVSSFVVYLGGFSLIRFGYNRPHFAYYGTVPVEDFKRLTMYTCLAVAVEALNVAAMQRWFWAPRRLSVVRRLNNVCSNLGFQLYVLAGVGGVGTNIFVADIKIATLSQPAL